MRGAAMPNDSRSPWSSTTERPLQRVRRDVPRHLGERQVRRRERDPQLPGDEQHHRVRAAGFRGEVFRVALERNAGVVDRGLLHRRRHHRSEAAGDAALGRRIEQCEHVAGVRGVRPARRRRAAEPRSQHRQRSGAVRDGRGVSAPFGRLEWQPEPACARGEQVGVAGEDESRMASRRARRRARDRARRRPARRS